MTKSWITRGHEDDDKLHAALLARLKALQPFGDHTSFEHEKIRDLRPRITALEQDAVQKIMRAYQSGPHTKRALSDALVKVIEVAAQPLNRYFAAPNASGDVLGFNPANEARDEVREIIRAGLATLKTKMPIITDRPQSDVEQTLRYANRFWLVSPVDAIDHDDASISIALIDRGKPIAGVVHFPKLGRTYAGTVGDNGFAFAKTAHRTRKIHVKLREDFRRVAATDHNAGTSNAFADLRRTHHVKRRFAEASAPYGLCRMAQGTLDAYLETDLVQQAAVAASHAVLSAAGGTLMAMDGKPVTYGPQGRVLALPPFVAGSDEDALKARYIARLVA